MDDCALSISKYISNINWKSFIFTCKSFYKCNTFQEVNKRSNHLWTIIYKYPYEVYDWFEVSANVNTTWDIVMENWNDKKYKFEVSGLIRNPNITLDIIHNNDIFKEITYSDIIYIRIHKKVDPLGRRVQRAMDYYADLTREDAEAGILNHSIKSYLIRRVQTIPTIFNWELAKNKPNMRNLLTRNADITIDYIKKNPHLPWDYKSVFLNPNLTWRVILEWKSFWQPQLISRNTFSNT